MPYMLDRFQAASACLYLADGHVIYCDMVLLYRRKARRSWQARVGCPHFNVQWLNAALVYQLQTRHTLSLLSPLLIFIKYRANAELLVFTACRREQSAGDALVYLPDVIVSLTQRS
jgi:hypothetical protein